MLSSRFIGALQRLSPLSRMSIMLPEAIQISPYSPSSIIAVTSGSSIEGLLTRVNDPSCESPIILPILPDESPTSAMEEAGDLCNPPGHGKIDDPRPDRPKSESSISDPNRSTWVSYG